MNRTVPRVAWLLNHTTLRQFEVPLIRSLGFEVYTSKQLSSDADFCSASADLEDDRKLTLPGDIVDRLNRHNFYDDDMPADIASIINEHFDIVIASTFGKLISELPRYYTGRLVFRAFGREQPYNYMHLFRHFGGDDVLRRIERIKDRFWLAAGYESIPLAEESPLRERCVVLPLGLPEHILKPAERWRGNDARILFICPRIGSHPHYYGRIYKDFKRHLGDLPHLIGGNQPVPVADPAVQGFADELQYRGWFTDCRAMFYHSREPRHVHYHPLEAVAYGMPLIYMRDGLIGSFGAKLQAGACDTYEEAHGKLKRLLEGDETFAKEVQQSQGSMLQRFTLDYNQRVWREVFCRQIMGTQLPTNREAAV